jgi:UDP-3-O-[3-hydroxymyristoyl] glucosamine N-acyltransferase
MTAREIAELLNSSTELETELTSVSAPENATPAAIVFAQDEASLSAAVNSPAGLILAPRNTQADDKRILRVPDPRYAFALAAQALKPKRVGFIHPQAIIDPTAKIGQRVQIGPGAVIEANVTLGDDVTIAPRVTVHHGSTIGHRVILQSGAVVGSTGFGYVRNPQTQQYLLFPQQGTLIIEDDVEVGANTTIDRGALGETRIGSGSKIDNLVHIGHNCQIGKNVIIASGTGISGSCTIGDGAILAGQVGISDHCQIGPNLILGGQTGVFRGKSVTGNPGEAFAGTPAEPIGDYLKSIAAVRRLRDKK